MRKTLNRVVRRLASVLGASIVDERTGKKVGRAFVIPWGGRIHVIGLDNSPPLRARFAPQPKLCYWRQSISLRSHEPVDFPRETHHDA